MKAIKELLWVIAGQIAVAIGGFAAIKLLTNQMGAESYGLLAIGMTMAGALGMFVYGPMSQVALRYFPICRERGELSSFVRILIASQRKVALVILLMSVLLLPLVAEFAGMGWAELLFSSLLFGVVSGAFTMMVALQSAMRQRPSLAFFQSLDVWLRLAAALLLLCWLGNAGSIGLAGFALGSLVVVLLQGWTLRSQFITTHSGRVECGIDKKLYGEFGDYARPFVLFSGFSVVSQYADRWILQISEGEGSVGIYVAIYQIAAAVVTILVSVITQFVVPIIFERAGSMETNDQRVQSNRLVDRTVGVTSIIMGVMVVTSYLYGEWLVKIATNEQFSIHANLLWILMLGLAFFNIAQLYVLRGLNLTRSYIYLVPKAVQAVSFILVALILVGEFGMLGIGIALCASSLLYLLMVVRANTLLVGQVETKEIKP
jgi:O-antigen/teichoic acid export membrane protein